MNLTGHDQVAIEFRNRNRANAYLKGKTVAARFNYDYSDNEISEIAERCGELARRTRALHVIFNNNCLDYAPRAGIRLRKALASLS